MDSQIPLTLPALPPTDGIPIAAFVTVISNLVIVLIAIAFGFYYIGGPFWEIVIINVTSRFPFLIEWFNRAPPSCILTKAIRIYLHDEALCSGGGGEGGREEESAKSEVTKSRQKDVPIGSVGSFDELANAFALPKFGSLDGTASPKTAYFQNPFRDSSNLSAITSSASTPALTTNLPTMPPPTHTTPVSPKDVCLPYPFEEQPPRWTGPPMSPKIDISSSKAFDEPIPQSPPPSWSATALPLSINTSFAMHQNHALTIRTSLKSPTGNDLQKPQSPHTPKSSVGHFQPSPPARSTSRLLSDETTLSMHLERISSPVAGTLVSSPTSSSGAIGNGMAASSMPIGAAAPHMPVVSQSVPVSRPHSIIASDPVPPYPSESSVDSTYNVVNEKQSKG